MLTINNGFAEFGRQITFLSYIEMDVRVISYTITTFLVYVCVSILLLCQTHKGMFDVTY